MINVRILILFLNNFLKFKIKNVLSQPYGKYKSMDLFLLPAEATSSAVDNNDCTKVCY